MASRVVLRLRSRSQLQSMSWHLRSYEVKTLLSNTCTKHGFVVASGAEHSIYVFASDYKAVRVAAAPSDNGPPRERTSRSVAKSPLSMVASSAASKSHIRPIAPLRSTSGSMLMATLFHRVGVG